MQERRCTSRFPMGTEAFPAELHRRPSHRAIQALSLVTFLAIQAPLRGAAAAWPGATPSQWPPVG